MKALLVSAAAAVLFASPAIAKDKVDEAIDIAKAALDEPGFSGSVAIFRGGKPALLASRGLADNETGRPVTDDTRLNIASVGKFLTAAAVVEALSEAGLTLDTPAGRFFAADAPTLFADDVTVADLLAHRTSAADFWSAPGAQDRMLAARNNADLFALTVDAQKAAISKRAGAPVYSNSNFVILGEIIARLSGKSYERYLTDEILVPGGAPHAAFASAGDADRLGLARGYLPEGFTAGPNGPGRVDMDAPQPADYPVASTDPLARQVTSAAGGLYISAQELAAVAGALFTGKIGAPDTLKTICSPSGEPTPPRFFGMGCAGYDAGHGMRRWGHNGGAPGVNAELAIYPDQNLVVVILSNHEGRAFPIRMRMDGVLLTSP